MIFGRAENIRILGYLSGFGGAGIGGEFPLPLSFNTMQYFGSTPILVDKEVFDGV